MRLTPELVRNAQEYLNPLKERELGLRGTPFFPPFTLLQSKPFGSHAIVLNCKM